MDGQTKPVLDGNLENFGFRLLGPYLSSFCAWLSSLHCKAGPDAHLLFVARDGYLPYLVYRTLYPERADHCAYVLASRVSTQLCNIKDEAGATAWIKQVEKSADLLSVLQRTVGNTSKLNEPLVCKIAELHRTAYQQYLSNLVGPRTPIVVDVGYGGSTQAIFAKILKRSVIGAYFVTHDSAKIAERNAGRVYSFDASFVHQHARIGLINRHRHLFETILSEPSGSFLCFTAPEKPIFDSIKLGHHETALLAKIRYGVDCYVKGVVNGKLAEKPQTEIRDALQSFLQKPHPADAIHFSGLSFDDVLKGAARQYFVAPEDERTQAFALWPEGQEAIDVARGVSSDFKTMPVGLRFENWLMRLFLSTVKYSYYKSNRSLYFATLGGRHQAFLNLGLCIAKRMFEKAQKLI